jgi:ribosomal RNA-processing protein 1
LENLVNSLRGGAGEDEGEGEGEMYKNVLRRVFDVASRDDCREANRKKMYALWREGMEVVSEGAGVGEGEEGS